MKFLQVFHRKARRNFDAISGYDDIKDIIRRALDSEDNYNLLLTGPPASAKTLWPLGIMDRKKNSVYFDGSNTTNRMLEVLEEERPDIICIDKIDKMSKLFQNKLLNLLESGRVKVDQKNLQLDFELKNLKVFATSNDLSKLSKPLASRFRRLNLPKYTKDQFLHVAIKVLPRLAEETALFIGEKVWDMKGDVRSIISIGKLVREEDGPEEIQQIMTTLIKYGDHQDESD